MKVVFDCFVLPHLGRIRNSVGWVLLLDLILVMCFFFLPKPLLCIFAALQVLE